MQVLHVGFKPHMHTHASGFYDHSSLSVSGMLRVFSSQIDPLDGRNYMLAIELRLIAILISRVALA